MSLTPDETKLLRVALEKGAFSGDQPAANYKVTSQDMENVSKLSDDQIRPVLSLFKAGYALQLQNQVLRASQRLSALQSELDAVNAIVISQ